MPELLSLHSRVLEPQLLSLRPRAREPQLLEPMRPKARALQQEQPPQ